MPKHLGRLVVCVLVAATMFALASPLRILADTTVTSTTYGSGTFGACNYQTCPITLSSNGAVNLDVSSPSLSGSCTVQSDVVSVQTANSAGYTLQVANSSTNTAMVNGASTIPAVAGTLASPASMSANAWGYRVDGLGSFGSGPTTAQSNISAPISSFAGVPASNATAATLATTSVAADPAQTTTVWYGLCANTSIPNGTYSTTVTYTATTN